MFFGLFFIYSCNRENKDNNNTTDNSDNQNVVENNSENLFSAKVENQSLRINNAFYEKEDNILIITALSENDEHIFIIANSDQQGKNEIDSRSYFANEEETFYANKGTFEITANESGQISGTFNFEVKGFTDSTQIKNISGEFNKITLAKSFSKGDQKITTTQTMEVNTTQGTVDYKDCNFEISVENNTVVFRNQDDLKKSFSVKITTDSESGTAGVYSSSDMEIEQVFVDILKNQVTIFYKNGNSKVFY